MTNCLLKIYLKNINKIVVNLAAQAGVRYSLKNPHSYVESNVVGFLNILKDVDIQNQKILFMQVVAQYMDNLNMPFKEDQKLIIL